MYSNAKIRFTGNLVRDPELKQVKDSTLCSFCVAVHTGEKKDDGTYGTDYYNCSAWGTATAAYLMNTLQKGTLVSVTGDLRTKSYISDKDGTARTDLRTNVFDVDVLARRKGYERDRDAAEAS